TDTATHDAVSEADGTANDATSDGSSDAASDAAVCATDSGDACDDCVGAHCCAQEDACYNDNVCSTADGALDTCLDTADGGADGGVGACWNTFKASGQPAVDIYNCKHTYCLNECNAP